MLFCAAQIVERFEIFDLTAQELKEMIARYDKDPLAKLRELTSQGEMHSSALQPLAMDALRIWKHNKEKQIMHSDLQAADYSERERKEDEHLTAAERKIRRKQRLHEIQEERHAKHTAAQKAERQRILNEKRRKRQMEVQRRKRGRHEAVEQKRQERKEAEDDFRAFIMDERQDVFEAVAADREAHLGTLPFL